MRGKYNFKPAKKEESPEPQEPNQEEPVVSEISQEEVIEEEEDIIEETKPDDSLEEGKENRGRYHWKGGKRGPYKMKGRRNDGIASIALPQDIINQAKKKAQDERISLSEVLRRDYFNIKSDE